MSSSTVPQEPRPFVRAVRKIKCAAMVHSLAQSWQGWARQNTDRQDAVPSGWTPDSVTEGGERTSERSAATVKPTPRVAEADADGGTGIKTGAVTKSVALPRCGKGGGDLVSALRERIMAPEEPGDKDFLGGGSPTRRRHARALARQNQAPGPDQTTGSRSSSLDTEDSGLGEEATLSDNGDSRTEQNEARMKKPSRPKIKVSTMGDIRSRWQQWSVQHVEGQRLNPFSEEFDYEHAMAQRLQKGDAGYGRPKEGSRTAERGDRAQKHVHREMEEMCFIIRDMGLTDKLGRTYISFGRLFDRYVKISDKVVGILLRCRKHKMVDFEGEMLWKGQDDHVIITLRD